VLAWSPRGYVDAHAGRSETSLLLALEPDRVRLELAAPGTTQPLLEIIDQLRANGLRAVSPTGVLGDPSGASADEGSALLDSLTLDLLMEVEAFVA
jgi:creatinine amidohydrolase